MKYSLHFLDKTLLDTHFRCRKLKYTDNENHNSASLGLSNVYKKVIYLN